MIIIIIIIIIIILLLILIILIIIIILLIIQDRCIGRAYWSSELSVLLSALCSLLFSAGLVPGLAAAASAMHSPFVGLRLGGKGEREKALPRTKSIDRWI